MSNSRIVVYMLLCSLSAALCTSCGRYDNNKNSDAKVIAKIGRYSLTAADFKAEAQDLPGGLSDADFEKLKESLLDGIITKKVLIQEAQAQNFDKDRAFIIEIERYWEQALLKSLYNKKSQEILRSVEAEELAYPGGLEKDAKDKKVREELGRWIETLKARADIKKYPENLKDIKQE